ncbi:MAG: hypothetical protein U1E17_06540 [Geminicoccaceae bacterium]
MRELALRVAMLGLARLPRGRVVIAANHPTRLAGQGRGLAGVPPHPARSPRCWPMATRSASPPACAVFIPVEWARSRRTQAGGRRLLADVAEAMAQERAVVLFLGPPRLRRFSRGLTERPLARHGDLAGAPPVPILPLHPRATVLCSTRCFPARHRAARRDLFHELLNKQGQRYTLTLGPADRPGGAADDPTMAIGLLQRHVDTTCRAPPPGSRASPPRPPATGTDRRQRHGCGPCDSAFPRLESTPMSIVGASGIGLAARQLRRS